jgi:DNA-directed RNA polymerase specialized sigma24 family protein
MNYYEAKRRELVEERWDTELAPAIRRALRAKRATTHDVEEIEQETRITVLCVSEGNLPHTNEIGWVVTIAVRIWINGWRDGKRRRIDAVPVEDRADSMVDRTAVDPSDLMARSESGEIVIAAWAELDVELADVLWERAVEGRKFSEIRDRDKIPFTTVANRYKRARNKLLEKLESSLDDLR